MEGIPKHGPILEEDLSDFNSLVEKLQAICHK
jgi:hypothetical protein